MKKKQAISAALAGFVAASGVIPAQISAETVEFSDLKPGDSHYETVMALANAGIINGYPDGTFKPNQPLMKRHIAILFTKALGLSTPEQVDDLPFNDVNTDSDLAGFLSVLLNEGIIEEDSTYQPGKILTREEMAGWISKAFNLHPKENQSVTINDFSDISPDYRNAVLALYHYGITRGKPDGTFDPKAGVTRGQLATFLYKSLTLKEMMQIQELEDITVRTGEQPSLPEEVKVLLTDGTVETFPVSWNTDELNTNNPGSYTLSGLIQGTLTTIEMDVHVRNTIITEVLNPEPISIIQGEELDLPDQIEAINSKGEKEMVQVTWDTGSLGTEPGTYELTGEVNGTDFEVTIEVTIEPDVLQVERVRALNLKQAVIEFNKPVDNPTTLSNKYLYRLFDQYNQPVDIEHVEVQDNQIILTAKESVGQITGKLLLREDITGDEQVFDIHFRDTEPPELTSIQAISPEQVEITFSEPMNVDAENGEEITNRDIRGAFKLKDEVNWINSIHVYDYGKTLVIDFSNDLDEGNHTLSISDELRDYFGLKLTDEAYSFQVSDDQEPPAVTKVERAYPNFVVLSFDKAIEFDDSIPEDDIITTNGDHPKDVLIENRKQLYVYFDEEDALDNGDAITIKAGVIKDLFGNRNDEIIQPIRMNDDEKEPTVANVELVDEKQTDSSYIELLVHLSEPVDENLISREDLLVVNSSGDEIPVKTVEVYAEDLSKQTYLVTLDRRYGQLNKDEYTLYIQDLEDMHGNINEQAEYLFEASSITRPGNFEGFAIANENQEIIFGLTFDRPMATEGQYSIEIPAKYQVSFDNQSYLLSDFKDLEGVQVNVHSYEDGKQAEVIIKYDYVADEDARVFLENLNEAIVDGETDDIQFIVGQVADKNGITTSSFYNPVSLTDDYHFGIDEAKVIARDTVTVHLSDEIRFLNEDDFILFADDDRDGKYDRGEDLDFSADYTSENGETIITFTMHDQLNTDGTYRGDTVYIASAEETATQNKFGQTIEFDQTKVYDAIPAELVTKDGEPQISIHPYKFNEGKAIIKMPFTEKMDEATISRLTFQLEGSKYQIEEAYVDDEDILLIVDLGEDQAGDLIGETIIQIAPIADTGNNIIQNIEASIEILGEARYK